MADRPTVSKYSANTIQWSAAISFTWTVILKLFYRPKWQTLKGVIAMGCQCLKVGGRAKKYSSWPKNTEVTSYSVLHPLKSPMCKLNIKLTFSWSLMEFNRQCFYCRIIINLFFGIFVYILFYYNTPYHGPYIYF